jgi:hypothetical protein
MPKSLEEQKKQFRIIYELLHKNPRIYIKDIASVLNINPHATSKKLEKAFVEGYVLPPQLRIRSFANMKEYMYFIHCDSVSKYYLTYIEDERVVYHAVMGGFANLWIISQGKIEVPGDIICEGFRSDYHVAHATDHSWQKAITLMKEKIKNFNPRNYHPKGIVQTRYHESIAWDLNFQTLYREFKYNVRNKLSPIMKRNRISAEKIYKFFDVLSDTCTVFSRYFPQTLSAYDPYLFMFKTDYEDFIISLFSELPTSPLFFKVSDRLFVYVDVARQYLRNVHESTNISRLHIPLLINDLLKRKIIEHEDHAILEYHWGKDL